MMRMTFLGLITQINQHTGMNSLILIKRRTMKSFELIQ